MRTEYSGTENVHKVALAGNVATDNVFDQFDHTKVSSSAKPVCSCFLWDIKVVGDFCTAGRSYGKSALSTEQRLADRRTGLLHNAGNGDARKESIVLTIQPLYD